MAELPTAIIERSVTVTSGDGEVVNAHLKLCPICGAATWIFYRIAGQAHDHLQCAVYDTSFCYGGKCDPHKVISGN